MLPEHLRTWARKIVDAAWQECTESEEVPATDWADRIIDSIGEPESSNFAFNIPPDATITGAEITLARGLRHNASIDLRPANVTRLDDVPYWRPMNPYNFMTDFDSWFAFEWKCTIDREQIDRMLDDMVRRITFGI